MTKSKQLAAAFTTLAMLVGVGTAARRAMRQRARRVRGLEAAAFAGEARAKGIGASSVSALMGANYAQASAPSMPIAARGVSAFRSMRSWSSAAVRP